MAKQDDITALLAPLVEDLGYELVGIEYNAHPTNGKLLLYIDQAESGVMLKDCERVSREVSALLDVHDPIPGRYQLEVSSPGLNRPLFTVEHFSRFRGEEVALTALMPVDGRRKFKGIIKNVVEDAITIELDGEQVEIAHGNIAKARLVPQI